MTNLNSELNLEELDAIVGGKDKVNNITVDLGYVNISMSTCGNVWSYGMAFNNGPAVGAAGHY